MNRAQAAGFTVAGAVVASALYVFQPSPECSFPLLHRSQAGAFVAAPQDAACDVLPEGSVPVVQMGDDLSALDDLRARFDGPVAVLLCELPSPPVAEALAERAEFILVSQEMHTPFLVARGMLARHGAYVIPYGGGGCAD